MLKYKNFIKIFEINNLNNPDPFNEEDWDEIDNYDDDDENEDIVIDYYGNEINREEAYFIDDYYFHVDDLKWSDYDNNYYSPLNQDIIWIDTEWGGDYVHIDDLKWSEKYNTFFHPNDDKITFVDNDWVYYDDVIYSNYKNENILHDKSAYSRLFNSHLKEDESIYCDHDDDYIPIEHAVKLEDNTFTIIDNVVKIDDKLYHKNTINK